MKHKGHLLLPGETGHGLKVDLLLDKAHVEVVSESESLGKWKYAEVVTTSLSDNRFDLQLASEQLVFTPSDATTFVETGLPLLQPPSEDVPKTTPKTPKGQQMSWRDRFSEALLAPLGARAKGHQTPDIPTQDEAPASEPAAAVASTWAGADGPIEFETHVSETAAVIDAPFVADPKPVGAKEEDPDLSHPTLSEPDVMEPDVTEPDVMEPDVTEPDVTEPDVTEPDVTEPEVTEPADKEQQVAEQNLELAATPRGPLDAALSGPRTATALMQQTQPAPASVVEELGPLDTATSRVEIEPSKINFIEVSDPVLDQLPEDYEPSTQAPPAPNLPTQKVALSGGQPMERSQEPTLEEDVSPSQDEANASLASAVGRAEASLTPMPEIVARLQRGIVDLQEHRITVEEAHALAELAQAMCRTVEAARLSGEDE